MPAEPETPKTVTLWRPGRQGQRGDRANRGAQARQRHDAPAGNGGEDEGRGKQGRKRGPKKGRGRNKPLENRVEAKSKPAKRPERASRPVDPDSPFAKLAQLKAELEKRDG